MKKLYVNGSAPIVFPGLWPDKEKERKERSAGGVPLCWCV